MADELVVTPEMRAAVMAQECKFRGHAFVTVVSAAGDPVTVMCERCPKAWKLVARDDR